MAKNDIDELIGEETKKGKAAKAKTAKPEKKAMAKPEKKVTAKPEKKATVKPKKKAKAEANGVRLRSKDFPRDGAERNKLRNLIVTKVKSAISIRDFSNKNDVDIAKVRLAVKDLLLDKKIKASKSGKEGGGFVMLAPK